MYQIKLTARAKRQLEDIKKIHLDIIDAIFNDIKEDPYIGKSLARELIGRYSYNVSVFRIIYKINHKDSIVIVLTVGHRSSVYK